MNREVLINIINRGGIRFIPVRRCFLCNEYVGYKFVRMCDGSYLDGVFGCLGNEKFYVCQPISLYETTRNIQERPALYAFKIATAYFREQGLVPVFENSHCKLMRL